MNAQIGTRSRSWPAVALSTLVAIGALLTAPMLVGSQEDEAAAGIAGAYTTTIAAGDVPSGLANGDALTGRWVLTLGDDGAFTLARTDVGEVVSGTYEAGPATLDLTAWSGLIGCGSSASDEQAATYAWRMSDDRLTLTPIADTCPERLTLLTAHDFGNLDVCSTPQQASFDPFTITRQGTPAAGPEVGQGVAAQEGYGEGSEVEEAVDAVLQQANGCWAAADAEQFMALHSQGVVTQIGIMGPPEQFARELQAFMDAPLQLERIGPVQMDDPNHAWAYVEVDLDGQRNPQRMTFVLEQGAWLLDTFFLFGPALPGGPGMPLP